MLVMQISGGRNKWLNLFKIGDKLYQSIPKQMQFDLAEVLKYNQFFFKTNKEVIIFDSLFL